MAKEVLEYDLIPVDRDVDLGDVINAVPKLLPHGTFLLASRIRPIGFGLMKVNVEFLIKSPSAERRSRLERALGSIPGIDRMERTAATAYPN